MRGSGQGLVYNTGRGLGAFAPPLVGFLGDHPPTWFANLAWLVSEPLALAMMIVSVAACGLAMFTLIFLPETKGKELQIFR